MPQGIKLTNTNNPFCFIFFAPHSYEGGFITMVFTWFEFCLLVLFCDWYIELLKFVFNGLGVSIALRKYPVTSRTRKSSSVAAKVVPG